MRDTEGFWRDRETKDQKGIKESRRDKRIVENGISEGSRKY